MNLLLENAFVKNIPLIILVGLLVVLLVVNFMRRKKYNTQMDKMQSDLKKGDEIISYSGVIGTILEFRDGANGRSLLIKTGKGDKVGFMEIDSKAVYGLLNPKTAVEPKVETKSAPIVEEVPATELPNPQPKKKK